LGNFQGNKFRNPAGQAFHLHLSQEVAQDPPRHLDPDGLSDEAQGNGDDDLLFHGNFVEIHVEHIPGNGVELEFLDDDLAFPEFFPFQIQLKDGVCPAGRAQKMFELFHVKAHP